MDGPIDSINSFSALKPEDQDCEPDKAIKVYSFACRIAYPEQAAHYEHQLTLTHRHRNLLTEILLKGRETYRGIINKSLGVDIKELQDKADKITTEIGTVKQEIGDWKKKNGQVKPIRS